ncbi:MAG: hypothetical protein ACRBBW_10140 [Cellvibrionaceae bacterium]
MLFNHRFITVLRILALSFFLGACAVTNEFQVVEYQTETASPLPPVSVFYKQPDTDFRRACKAYAEASVMDHCTINRVNMSAVADALYESRLFEAVDYRNEDSEYQLLVSSATYNNESGEDIGSAVVSGATLMLAPMSISTIIKIEAALVWRGMLVERYQFEVPFTQRMSLLTMDQNTDADLGKSIASHFLQKFQQDDIFSAEVLVGRLESSDYRKELVLPEQVGPFIKDDLYLYRHPFQGAQTRYVHDRFGFSYVDVFVYPIRQIHWESGDHILEKEVGNYRKDLELMEKELMMNDLAFEADSRELWHLGDGSQSVARVISRFRDQEAADMVSQMYLFHQKDKFIKVRATYESELETKPDVEGFVRELSASILVPDESLFMAKIRKRWRENDVQ